MSGYSVVLVIEYLQEKLLLIRKGMWKEPKRERTARAIMRYSKV